MKKKKTGMMMDEPMMKKRMKKKMGMMMDEPMPLPKRKMAKKKGKGKKRIPRPASR